MSHYTVLVVGENIEEQLAPFQENNMGDCPNEYLEFNDVEEEYNESYKTDTAHCYVEPDGKPHCKYDSRFKETGEYICPDGWTEEEVPVKELYSFEEYIEDYCGYTKDEETGKYGYWENPNAKWDWYQTGGRWAGSFKIKPEYQDLYLKEEPNFSWGWDEESKNDDIQSMRVDSAIKKHIDFDSIMAEAGEKARAEYKKVTSYLSKHGGEDFKPWKYFLDKRDNDEITIDEAREQYREQQAKKEQRDSKDELGENAVWIELDNFIDISEDEYVDKKRIQSIMFFAILKDGKWAERGKMGWWACVSDEKDDWEDIYMKILDSVDDDDRLTVVDCHI